MGTYISPPQEVCGTSKGSSPLMGDDEYSLDTIDHSVPATMGKDPESVIIKVPKSRLSPMNGG